MTFLIVPMTMHQRSNEIVNESRKHDMYRSSSWTHKSIPGFIWSTNLKIKCCCVFHICSFQPSRKTEYNNEINFSSKMNPLLVSINQTKKSSSLPLAMARGWPKDQASCLMNAQFSSRWEISRFNIWVGLSSFKIKIIDRKDSK